MEFNKLLGTKKYYNKDKMNFQLERYIDTKHEIEEQAKNRILYEREKLQAEEDEENEKKLKELEAYKKRLTSDAQGGEDYVIGSQPEAYFKMTMLGVHSTFNKEHELAEFLKFKEKVRIKNEKKNEEENKKDKEKDEKVKN